MKIGIAALTFALLTLHAESAKCVVTYTFDDGLADQYTLAYPMFRKAGLPAAFFIIGSKVGDPRGMRNKAERHTPVMTWEQIRDMSTNGMEIASHGWAHAKYAKMSRDEILDDIRRNQVALKENAGVDCVSFASPFNANKGSADVAAEIRGAAVPVSDGAIGGALRISASTNSTGCVFLKGSERLAFEKGAEFGFAVWVRTFGPQVGDPVVFANKNWSAGSNPGIALIAERSVPIKYGYKIRGDKPGVMFNCGRVGKQREDLGQYNPEHGEWTFYAITRDADGVVRFYQGRRDGNLHCVADDLSDIALKTGLPFFLGQDGTGKYRHPFVGDIDEFSLWTRTLSHEEVRRVFEYGRCSR